MENKKSTFTIENITDLEMTIVHEPECIEFNLPANEELILNNQIPMENRKSTFTIENITDLEMTIVHEPECFEFSLPVNEQLIIETKCCEESVVLQTWIDNGRVVIAILNEKSFYNVLYKGVNVFEKFF
jgi:hypothetical protein